MLDRVRQAVFNIIGAAYGDPGSVPPVAELDVFAGSGALGMEAISRGAAYCCFVEEDSGAVRTLQGNLKTLGLHKQSQVLQLSALKLKAPRPAQGMYTIVFLDPPYPLSRGQLARQSGRAVAGQAARTGLTWIPRCWSCCGTKVAVHYDQQAYGRLEVV